MTSILISCFHDMSGQTRSGIILLYNCSQWQKTIYNSYFINAS
uniref:Uncharacterized protein n=1 Tax=Rhizophora mucronata TaxID=61149 RepID=A0A2P2P621_RHIMU